MIELADLKSCTGCASCYNSCPKDAISMSKDAEGFLNPLIDEKSCIECGLCIRSCPVLTSKKVQLVVPEVYAGYIADDTIRKSSSSGGMFSAIAKKFFETKSERDKYLVAAQFDEHLTLRHIIIDSYDDIIKMRGSKYVQSEIGTIYKDIRDLLIRNSEVLFIGTPCQVAGLYGFLRNKQYDNLSTVDLICHGVPSPMLFAKYLTKIGVSNKKSYYDYWFRDYKSTGFFVSSIFQHKNRRKKIKIKQHSYITAYLRGWIHRECCYNCKFHGFPRQADCTIGDFWGIISKKIPFKGNREHGISVIIGNTEKGKKIISNISDITYLEPHTIEEAIIDNHNLVESDKRPKERDYICEELIKLSPEVFMEKYKLHLPHLSLAQIMRSYLAKHLRQFLKV